MVLHINLRTLQVMILYDELRKPIQQVLAFLFGNLIDTLTMRPDREH